MYDGCDKTMNNEGNGGVVERRHELAYLVWDTNSKEELDHLRDVFDSCIRIRCEQFRVMDEVMSREGLRVEFVPLEVR